jgi:hypothetical protein
MGADKVIAAREHGNKDREHAKKYSVAAENRMLSELQIKTREKQSVAKENRRQKHNAVWNSLGKYAEIVWN